jgi:cytidyltransferase-like protein
MITVAVSGGFDPVRIGHLSDICQARELGDRLMVILMRDDQLITENGCCFVPYHERKAIIEKISGVDMVLPNIDDDLSAVLSLERYRPDIFAKAGNGTVGNTSAEEIMCQKIGCRIVYGMGVGKIKTSSPLVARFASLRKDLVITGDRVSLTIP